MRIFFLTVGIALLGISCSDLTGTRQERDVVVFYPEGFDSTATMPSLAIVDENELDTVLPAEWNVIPEFYLTDDNKHAVRIDIAEGTDIYGTGEVLGGLRRNGKEVVLWNTDNYAYGKMEGKQLYQSHPWILGVREDGSSFGVIADHTWKQTINTSDPVTFISEGPAFRVIIIEQDSPQEVLKTLARLAGKMQLPPLWSLGYQQSRYSYYPDTSVMALADEFRERHIPLDVIWMDIDYMDGFRIFTFDPEGFPDPEKLNQYLHSKKVKSVYMIDPGVKVDTGYWVFDQGTEGNHWVLDSAGEPYTGEVWPGETAFPDFTRPETRQWWSGLYDSLMLLGVDGVWNDMNEPAVFDGPDGSMPVSNQHRGGGELPPGPHLRYHNVYGLLMVKASLEGLMANHPERRPFILSRANFLGGHRYAATWTGDNNSTFDDLKMSIPMSLNLSLSGQPFNGPDIGGFVGSPTPEVLGHWMSVGAFYPFSRNHTSTGEAQQEPWAMGKAVENASRRAIEMRYQLLPYLYTLFRESSTSGMPIMQPAFFADPTDPQLRDEDEVFLLGTDLLVKPSWAEDPELPAGNWKALPFTIGSDSSGQKYLPELLIRPGAIVPSGKIIQSTADYQSDSLTLWVSLDTLGNAQGYLYDDEGDGFGYQQGEYEVLIFSAAKTDKSLLSVKMNHAEGNWKKSRIYRVGWIEGDSVEYSGWTNDAEFSFSPN